VPFILAFAKSDKPASKELVVCWKGLFSSGYVVFLGALVGRCKLNSVDP
jgi:hypothetical protein